MTREAYQGALRGLHESVLDLGVLVEAQLERGIEALVSHDPSAANRLHRDDDPIDDATRRIERACIDLLSLQQPVASDMRLVASSFKIVTDLERVADLAVNLGDYCSASSSLDLVGPDAIDRAGRLSMSMLRAALEAYRNRDVAEATRVIRRDTELDDLTWGTIRQFVKSLHQSERQGHDDLEAERISSQALPVLLSMRDIERVGDHACNIAERVLFIVTGRDGPVPA